MTDILLITSTIAPPAQSFLLAVTDAETRLSQYRAALAFYLEQLAAGTFDRIVYMDNSGHPLDALRDQVAAQELTQKVEFLSYQQTLAPENSRYFLETSLIDRAMQMSAVLTADPDAVIWKVTGRYIVSNVRNIVDSWPQDADLYVNLHNHPYKTLDFYFFGFRAGTYASHIGCDRQDFAGTRNGEDILREKLDAECFDGVNIVKRLRYTPKLAGVRGFDGARYGGWKDGLKYQARRFVNVVAPQIWI